MNNCLLIGRLTKDPEVRYATSGTAVASFSLAIDRPKKEGEEKKADFPRVTAFGKTAELIEKYVFKGSQIAVQGRIQTGSYEKDGVKVYTTDVVAEKVKFLGRPGGSAKAEGSVNEDGFQKIEDDVPF